MDERQVQQQAFDDALIADQNRRVIAEAIALSGVLGVLAAFACACVARLRRIRRVYE
jgi:hypothetical protein